MTDAPQRIWVVWPNINGCGLAFNAGAKNRTPYILATPEAIAASPEGAALIREAGARGMERLVQSLIGIRRASAHRMNGPRGDDHSYYFHTANAAIAAAEDALTKIARLGQEWDAEAAAIRAAKGEPE